MNVRKVQETGDQMSENERFEMKGGKVGCTNAAAAACRWIGIADV